MRRVGHEPQRLRPQALRARLREPSGACGVGGKGAAAGDATPRALRRERGAVRAAALVVVAAAVLVLGGIVAGGNPTPPSGRDGYGGVRGAGGGRRDAAPTDEAQSRPVARPEATQSPSLPHEEVHASRVYVSRVVDGDTVEVRLGAETVDVRLIGIDTPETKHPTVGLECYGLAASRFTTGQLGGERVRLEFDIERHDRYGRLLAYIWSDGRLFNRVLIARGFAHVATYPPNVKYVERLTAAQRRAKARERGLWGNCDGVTDDSSGEGRSSGGGGSTGSGRCDRDYSGACVAPYPPDVDCDDVPSTDFESTGSDPHGLDGDGDGIACET